MSTNVLANVRAQHSQPSDEQLLSEARSGDDRAFAELCNRYTGLIKQRVFRIVRHREDAEDVLQETFLSAYQHLDSFRGKCSFPTWMTKIGINTSLMLLRKRKKVLTHTADVVNDDGQRIETLEFRDRRPNPEQRYMMYQTDQRIKRAIRRLPPRLSSMVDLYYGQECSLKELAKALGVSEAAAKSTIFRARNLLRRSLISNSKLCRSNSSRHEKPGNNIERALLRK
jgi:RNA polymerase sigma-70 factor (ECF subfamily)